MQKGQLTSLMEDCPTENTYVHRLIQPNWLAHLSVSSIEMELESWHCVKLFLYLRPVHDGYLHLIYISRCIFLFFSKTKSG